MNIVFFLSIILFLFSASLIFGFGWALFILDLLSGNVSADYASAQRDYKGSKKKIPGIVLMLVSVVMFVVPIMN